MSRPGNDQIYDRQSIHTHARTHAYIFFSFVFNSISTLWRTGQFWSLLVKKIDKENTVLKVFKFEDTGMVSESMT